MYIQGIRLTIIVITYIYILRVINELNRGEGEHKNKG